MSTAEPIKTMTVRGIRYVELDASTLKCHERFGVCVHCALFNRDGCMDAIEGAALGAFGGDCQQRDAIYKAA